MIRLFLSRLCSYWNKFFKIPLIYIFIFLTFIPLFHNNLFEQYFVKRIHIRDKKLYANQIIYHPLYNKLLRYSAAVAMRQTWTMFSPSWKITYRYEFQGVDKRGKPHRLNVPDLTKEYRESRSFLSAVFFDFKVARILASYFHDGKKPYGRFRSRLAGYYCAHDKEFFGIDLDKIIIYVYTRPIPPMKDIESRTFNPLTAKYDRVFFKDSFSCSES